MSSGQIGYDVKHPVFQFFNDSTYIYSDPSLGTSRKEKLSNGSVWGMVGDKLIENGICQQVVFSMCGWGGVTIQELSQGELYNYFRGNYFSLLNQFGKVDGILFHQGEANSYFHPIGNTEYYDVFSFFLDKMKKDGIHTNFYMSQVSYCSFGIDSTLLNIQNQIIVDFENVYRGPNTDLLIEQKYRLPDNCHFSMGGFNEFSNIWVKSIINSSEK